MWDMNRLVEDDLNAPPDFIEYYQLKAGHMGMRSRIFETETSVNIDEFMQKTLQRFVMGEG